MQGCDEQLLALLLEIYEETAVGGACVASAMHLTLSTLARWPMTGEERIIGACARLVMPFSGLQASSTAMHSTSTHLSLLPRLHMQVLFAALPAHACPLSALHAHAYTFSATQVCAALDKRVLYINMHDLSLHATSSEERLLRRQLRLAGRLVREAAFAGAVSQRVAMRMQAAGLPCLQPDAVQAWLDSGD